MDNTKEICHIIKKYNITAKELEDDNLSISQISRIKNKRVDIKKKHYKFFIEAINRVLKERGIKEEFNFYNLFYNLEKNDEKLEKLVNDAILDEKIKDKLKIREIIEFSEKYNIKNDKFRFILANWYKNEGKERDSLILFRELFEDLENDKFKTSILVNLSFLSKNEEVNYFYNRNKKLISKQNKKIKTVIYYQLALKYMNLGLYIKAKELFFKVINYGIINNNYFKSHTQLGNCYYNLCEYKLSTHHFSMGVSDIRDEKTVIKGLSKTLINHCKLNNLNELNKTLDKISILKKNYKVKIYNVNYEIAKSYEYKNDQINYIKFLEKEVFEELDYKTKEFDFSIFLKSVMSLMFLYKENKQKHLYLIRYLKKIPLNYFTSKEIVDVLNFYKNYNFFECIILFLNEEK